MANKERKVALVFCICKQMFRVHELPYEEFHQILVVPELLERSIGVVAIVTSIFRNL